jgi:hypothetical protein
MEDAQQKWRFLTNYDLSSIKTGVSSAQYGENALEHLGGRRNKTLMPGCRASNSDPLPLSLGPKQVRAPHDTGRPQGNKPSH